MTLGNAITKTPRTESQMRSTLDRLKRQSEATDAVAVTAASVFGTDDVLLASDGTGRGVKATAIDKDNVVTAALAFGTNEILLQADGTGKALKATSIAAADVVTAASNFTSGELVSAAGNDKTTQSSGVAADDVVTAADEFTTDNTVLRADGAGGKAAQASTLGVNDSGAIFQTDAAVSPNPIFTSSTTLAAITFEIRVYTAGLASLAFGAEAGASVTIGNQNIFIGKAAGTAVTEGSRNILIGVTAGEALVDGADNVFMGPEAGQFATGEGNVFIGALAGKGASGTSDGDENVAIGPNAGRALGTTTGNVLIGKNAGVNVTTGVANFCVGANAGTQLTTGSSNVFFGNNSGNNTSATVEETVAVGRTTCPVVTGNGNTAIGYQAGNDTTSGSNNTFIGRNAGNNASQLVTSANSMAIGNNTFTTASNQVMIGSSGVTQNLLRGTVDVVRSTNACQVNVYRTAADDPPDTDFELLALEWNGTSARVTTEKGSTGGTARALQLGTDGTTRIIIGAAGGFTIVDANDIAVGGTTGTKIATAVSQKLGFWNAAPVVQPAAANQAALANNTGGAYDGALAAVGDTSTTDQSGPINDNFTDLHTLLDEIRTALVNSGLIKGAA